MIKVAINGFGRIGKMLTRVLLEKEGIQVVAINDLADVNTQAHLFKYDSVHGGFQGSIEVSDENLIINGNSIRYSSEKELGNLDWQEVHAEVVVECTGKHTDRESCETHLERGAKRVIISAPSKDDSVKSILVGINEHILTAGDHVVSNASCTTNSAGPLVKILDDIAGIESAYITTVHSYTGDQRLHDSPHRDLRRARGGAMNIIPTTTGAAKAITKIFPHLDGRIGGAGIRVPVPNGSLTDISCIVKKSIDIESINEAFQHAAQNEMKGILQYTEDPIVSRDIIGNPHSCIFDAQLTSVIGNMVKVVGWYDNEVGYSNRLAELIPLLVHVGDKNP